ncbi:MAG: helix-turn-helix domain-containing protein [Lachnospiraceae bacterium]|nr:helix-turn-helix domain-containing protein [Lachnospiraceae bacterium]
MNRYITPEYTTGDEIKYIRNHLGMTQKEMAEFLRCSKPTVERWESSKDKHIVGPVVVLLDLIKRDNDIVEKLELPKDRLKLRLYYMFRDMVCTVIDIDEGRRKVRIKNYTDDLMYRAFGKNTEPTFDDYEMFIESRCFPRTRDKIKLELKRLDIPYYDPILIIEKTEGRMAEDEFYIKIER